MVSGNTVKQNLFIGRNFVFGQFPQLFQRLPNILFVLVRSPSVVDVSKMQDYIDLFVKNDVPEEVN